MITLEQIKTNAICDIMNLPDGFYQVKGGYGNAVVSEFKVENGVQYNLVNGQWVEHDIMTALDRVFPTDIQMNCRKNVIGKIFEKIFSKT